MPKILIIDDDPTMVSLLKTLLELDGYDVKGAERWDSVPSWVRAEGADALLMDCILPNADGLEILKDLRRAPEFRDLVVIMTSGMDMSDQCAALGADAFLLKPYEPTELLRVLQQQLDKQGGGASLTE